LTDQFAIILALKGIFYEDSQIYFDLASLAKQLFAQLSGDIFSKRRDLQQNNTRISPVKSVNETLRELRELIHRAD